MRTSVQECVVTVHDNGPGLPTEDAEELFAPFVSTRTEGLGMGLAITRTIVEAHGGRVTGATAPSGGADFTVRLPAAPPSEP
jgi:C4-dicarboxylate-specific signal transduction histidine kinase